MHTSSSDITRSADGAYDHPGLAEIIARAGAVSHAHSCDTTHIICGVSDVISCDETELELDKAGEMALRLGAAAYCAVNLRTDSFEVARAQPASKCTGPSYAGAFSDARPSEGKPIHEQGFLQTLRFMHHELRPQLLELLS